MASLAANMNIEKFIKDVENRPAIWNRSYHCNKQFMEETWRTLSRIHQLPVAALKAKWKGLRDNFRVEYKRIPRDENGELLMEPYEFQSKWTHYGALIFLVDHMRSRTQKMEPNDDNDLSQEHDPYYYEVNPQTQFDDIGFHFINNNSIQIPDDDEEDDILGGIPLMHSNDNGNDGGDDDGIRLNQNGGSDGGGGGGRDMHVVGGEDVDDLISESSPSMHLDGIVGLPPLISLVEPSDLNGNDKNQKRNQVNGGGGSLGGGRVNNGNISSSSSSVIRSASNIPNKKRRILPSTTNTTIDSSTTTTQYKTESQQNDSGQHRPSSATDQKIMDNHHQNHNNNHHNNHHQNQNIDDDYHFLMSLHPYMSELSASQKLQVRMKIQKLIFNELYNSNSNGEYME